MPEIGKMIRILLPKIPIISCERYTEARCLLTILVKIPDRKASREAVAAVIQHDPSRSRISNSHFKKALFLAAKKDDPELLCILLGVQTLPLPPQAEESRATPGDNIKAQMAAADFEVPHLNQLLKDCKLRMAAFVLSHRLAKGNNITAIRTISANALQRPELFEFLCAHKLFDVNIAMDIWGAVRMTDHALVKSLIDAGHTPTMLAVHRLILTPDNVGPNSVEFTIHSEAKKQWGQPRKDCTRELACLDILLSGQHDLMKVGIGSDNALAAAVAQGYEALTLKILEIHPSVNRSNAIIAALNRGDYETVDLLFSMNASMATFLPLPLSNGYYYLPNQNDTRIDLFICGLQKLGQKSSAILQYQSILDRIVNNEECNFEYVKAFLDQTNACINPSTITSSRTLRALKYLLERSDKWQLSQVSKEMFITSQVLSVRKGNPDHRLKLFLENGFPTNLSAVKEAFLDQLQPLVAWIGPRITIEVLKNLMKACSMSSSEKAQFAGEMVAKIEESGMTEEKSKELCSLFHEWGFL